MKFIPQSQLDKAAWNQFVEKNSSEPFSYSWYLDSCAADWCIFIDDQWENGIALPFSSNLGIESLTPVIFGRTLDFIGNDAQFQANALEAIQKRFKIGHLQTARKIPFQPEISKVHQIIDAEIKLGSQAKRMLKKAEKAGIIIQQTNDWEKIISIAETELTAKISEFNTLNLNRLRNLAQALSDSNKLMCLGIYENQQLTGGMLFVTTPQTNIYLKGSALPASKQQGGMYLCMHTFILQTLSESKTFDFGGSSVAGVRRFNYNFGGKDQNYYAYLWDRSPGWYRFLKKTHQKLKKK